MFDPHVYPTILRYFDQYLVVTYVKDRFSHIFPSPVGSLNQSLFLRYEIEKGLRTVMMLAYPLCLRRLRAIEESTLYNALADD